MCWGLMKWAVMGVVGLALVGGLVLGTDVGSYVTSSAKSVRTAVKGAVPVEFELQRARDLLDNIIPEMHANVRLIAQEEVQIANLRAEIEQGQRSLTDETTRVAKLRDTLTAQKVSYTLGGMNYSHQQVKEELARSFDRLKEAQVHLTSKERLLDTREKALQAAMAMLDRTRGQKVRLEDQIQALESQYRLVQAASVGSGVHIDNSKLAQTENLIRQIKQRLDVAERVLAHETRFVQPIAVDVINEQDLLAQVDDFLSPGQKQPSQTVAMKPEFNDVAEQGD